MESFDPLTIATFVANDFFEHKTPDHQWWSLDVWRLLTGGGWLVTGSRSAIVLEAWEARVAA